MTTEEIVKIAKKILKQDKTTYIYVNRDGYRITLEKITEDESRNSGIVSSKDNS